MCLGKLYDHVVVCAMSIYNKNSGRGSISVRALYEDSPSIASTPVVMSAQSPQTTDQRAIQDCVEAPPSSSLAVRKRKWTTPNPDTSKAVSSLSSHMQPSASQMVYSVSASAPSCMSRAQVGCKVQLFSSNTSSLLVTPHHHPPLRDKEQATKAPPRLLSSSKTTNSPLAQTVSPESRPMFTTTVEEKVSIGSSVDGRIEMVLTKTSSSDLTEDKEALSLLAYAKKGHQGDGAKTSTVNVSLVSAISKARNKDLVNSSCQQPPKNRGDIRSEAGPNRLWPVPCTSNEAKNLSEKLKVMKEQNDAAMCSIVTSLPVPWKKKRKSYENTLGTTTQSISMRKSSKVLSHDLTYESGTQLENAKLKFGQSPSVLPTNSKTKEVFGKQNSVSEHRPHFYLALSSEPESTNDRTATRDDHTPSAKPVPRVQLDTGKARILTPTSQNANIEKKSMSAMEDVRMAEEGFAILAPRRNSSPTSSTSKKSSKSIESELPGRADVLVLKREKATRQRDLMKRALTSTTKLVKDNAGVASISTEEDALPPINEESASLCKFQRTRHFLLVCQAPLVCLKTNCLLFIDGIANALCLFKNTSQRAKVSISDASTGLNPSNPARLDQNTLQNSALSTPVPSSPEDVVRVYHKRLKALLAGMSSKKKLHLSKSSVSHGNVETKRQEARALLQAHHLAAHRLVQKRLLQAAEATLRLLGDSFLSYEEATTELKASIQSYQEIMVRLQRQ
jgi:hypothetical protein